MTRDEVRDDLEDISGIGEATAEDILGVLDSHHPDGSFDGFAQDDAEPASGVGDAVAVLSDESRSYSARISMALSYLDTDDDEDEDEDGGE